jgi:hypothetical protein
MVLVDPQTRQSLSSHVDELNLVVSDVAASGDISSANLSRVNTIESYQPDRLPRAATTPGIQEVTMFAAGPLNWPSVQKALLRMSVLGQVLNFPAPSERLVP